MLKLCAPWECKSLTLFFENCLVSRHFPDVWEKSNIVPVHKKEDKQLIKNFQTVSLLPICRKLFVKLMFNSVFSFTDTRNMLSVHQSGFCPSEASMHQIILIVHDIYNAFDANPVLEVRGVFLDMFKTFGRVWHKGLLYNVKCMGIDRNFQTLVKSFLRNWCQHDVLNGETSSWADVKEGVPQGSIFSFLFFLIYHNHLSENLKSIVKSFADDTPIFHVDKDPQYINWNFKPWPY